MTDLDKMARDILDSIPDAAFGTAADFPEHAHVALESEARYAIRAALLTAPPGYVRVPVEPTEEMVDASMISVDLSKYGRRATLRVLGARAWAAMLAAAPNRAEP